MNKNQLTLKTLLFQFEKRINELVAAQDLDYAIIQTGRFIEVLWDAFKESYAKYFLTSRAEQKAYRHKKLKDHPNQLETDAKAHLRIETEEDKDTHSEPFIIHFYLEKMYRERCNLVHATGQRIRTVHETFPTLFEYLLALVKRLEKKFNQLQDIDSNELCDFSQKIIKRSKRFNYSDLYNKMDKIRKRIMDPPIQIEVMNDLDYVELYPTINDILDEQDLSKSKFTFVLTQILEEELDTFLAKDSPPVQLEQLLDQLLEKLSQAINHLFKKKSLKEDVEELIFRLDKIRRELSSETSYTQNTLCIFYKEIESSQSLDSQQLVFEDFYTYPMELNDSLCKLSNEFKEAFSLDDLRFKLDIIYDFIADQYANTQKEWIVLFLGQFEDSAATHPFQYHWLQHAVYSEDGKENKESLITEKEILTIAASPLPINPRRIKRWKIQLGKRSLPSVIQCQTQSICIQSLDSWDNTKDYILISVDGYSRLEIKTRWSLGRNPLLIACNDDFYQKDAWLEVKSFIAEHPQFKVNDLFNLIKKLSHSSEFRSNVLIYLTPKWLVNKLSPLSIPLKGHLR